MITQSEEHFVNFCQTRLAPTLDALAQVTGVGDIHCVLGGDLNDVPTEARECVVVPRRLPAWEAWLLGAKNGHVSSIHTHTFCDPSSLLLCLQDIN